MPPGRVLVVLVGLDTRDKRAVGKLENGASQAGRANVLRDRQCPGGRPGVPKIAGFEEEDGHRQTALRLRIEERLTGVGLLVHPEARREQPIRLDLGDVADPKGALQAVNDRPAERLLGSAPGSPAVRRSVELDLLVRRLLGRSGPKGGQKIPVGEHGQAREGEIGPRSAGVRLHQDACVDDPHVSFYLPRIAQTQDARMATRLRLHRDSPRRRPAAW